MAKKKKSEGPQKQDDFTLKDVLKLGGNKDDYEFLKNVDKGTEGDTMDDKEDFDVEPVKRDELLALIGDLGMTKARHDYLAEQQVEKKSKKEKKKQQKEEEHEDETMESESMPEKAEKLPKKKKKKNKFKVQEAEVSSTTVDLKVEPVDYLAMYKPRTHLLVKPGGKWYLQEFANDPSEFSPAAPALVRQLRKYAARLYEDEANLYKQYTDKKKRSESAWMKTVLSSGTVADRSAALTLLVQEAPIQNLVSLDSLIAMVHKKGHREAMAAMATLKELFMNDLLPDNRKLRTFDQHPLGNIETLSSGNKDSRDKRVLMWYYEEQLKERYASYIDGVKTRGQDTIAATKKKAIETMMELLSTKPEQEQVLLSALVNKLGDQTSKTASYVVHMMNKLVEHHPNMKYVVVQDVERMLYRPHISVKAQYYAICFLNQLDLSHREKDLAAKLIAVFFSFFKAFIKKGEVDSKMLSALLTGVNRVYPYAKVEHQKIHDQLQTLYQIVHLTNFNTGIQALMLLYQVMDTSDSANDRYYQALYRKLLHPGLRTSSKQAMFLNLLYKSLRKDTVDRRLKAFIKRLLQVCCHQMPPFICGALFLLSQVLSEKKTRLHLLQQNTELSDEEDEHFTDAPLEESNSEMTHSEQSQPSDSGKTSRLSAPLSDSDEEDEPKKRGTSWVHRSNLEDKWSGGQYDPHHRNPLFSLADKECVWELENLSHHYHPSVSLFAHKLLKGETIIYTGDPLQDFTLIRFLDRFVYKNPKKSKGDDKGTGRKFLQSKRKSYIPQGLKSIPVNSDEYILNDEASIPADETFFYRFFRQQSKAKTDDDVISETESISDDEFDEFMGKYEMTQGLDADGILGADFAGDFQRSNKKKKKGKSGEDSDSDLDIDSDLSDEEPDFSEDEELTGDFKMEGDDADFDEEDVAFSDNDEMVTGPTKVKGKRSAGSKFLDGPRKKKSRMDQGSLFAAAEKFADVIEENMGDKINTTGTEALSNKDKSGVKQLKWEMERDRKMMGKTWKGKRGKHNKKSHYKGSAQGKRKK